MRTTKRDGKCACALCSAENSKIISCICEHCTFNQNTVSKCLHRIAVSTEYVAADVCFKMIFECPYQLISLHHLKNSKQCDIVTD